jgi:hypothetical protein
MAKFLALYRSSTSAQEQMANVTPEHAQAGMEAWQAWAAMAADAQSQVNIRCRLSRPHTSDRFQRAERTT